MSTHSEVTYSLSVAEQTFTVLNSRDDLLLGPSLARTSTWEPWQIDLYSRLLGEDSVCLDIGGNIGTNALAMSVFSPKGKIYSFEPVNYTFSLLTRNLKGNHVTNVEPHNFGLSDVCGTGKMAVDMSLLANAHQVAPNSSPADDHLKFRQDFHTETLDRWSSDAGIGRVDLMKIDVEGFELEVLRGGNATISANPHLAAIVEFAIQPQRRYAPIAPMEVPKDVLLYRELRRLFKHMFLICRTGELCPVRSYAHLRNLMLRGYPVEDLLCCNMVPERAAEKIVSGSLFRSRHPESHIVGDDYIIVISNRDADGWAGESFGLQGARSGICVTNVKEVTGILRFQALISSISMFPTHTTMLVYDDEARTIDPTDRSESSEIAFRPGVHWLLLECNHEMRATGYLGNPSDSRKIGFRFSLEPWEHLF